MVMTNELPATLYKYYEVKEFLPKVLSGEALKFSCPMDFNDPFESRSCFQIDNSKEGKRYIHEKVKQRFSNPSQRIAKARQIERRFNAPQSLDDDAIIRLVGVCCFSEMKDSILMWSHYANEHKGVCIGFDTRKSLFRLAWQVKYQEEFPIVRRPTDSDEILLAKTLLTKADCWSYEKEWRIIKRTQTEFERDYRLRKRYSSNENLSEEDIQLLVDEKGPGFYSFPKEAITEIYLGARIEKNQREKVIQGVRDANLNIPIYEAQRNPKKYCLEFKLIKSA
ncbi:MAG: DUF2971 domain-containing protein [Nitrosomonadales bacterium]|nr:DUF2971 domain-containing protein [Nitrosomonadales bacterium]